MEIYNSSHTAAELEYALSAIPSIGENGNWYIGDQDTGIVAGGSSYKTLLDVDLDLEAVKIIEHALEESDFSTYTIFLCFYDNMEKNSGVSGSPTMSVDGYTSVLYYDASFDFNTTSPTLAITLTPFNYINIDYNGIRTSETGRLRQLTRWSASSAYYSSATPINKLCYGPNSDLLGKISINMPGEYTGSVHIAVLAAK